MGVGDSEGGDNGGVYRYLLGGRGYGKVGTEGEGWKGGGVKDEKEELDRMNEKGERRRIGSCCLTVTVPARLFGRGVLWGWGI